MINRIKTLFRQGQDQAPRPHGADELQLAAAALLVEAAHMDAVYDDAERDAVAGALRRRFGLNEEECADLLAEAEAAQHDSTHLYHFTRTVKDRFSPEERVELIEMLWEVVYADGVLHAYEANLMRRLGGLLYVPDQERGAARKRVLARLGTATEAIDS